MNLGNRSVYLALLVAGAGLVGAAVAFGRGGSGPVASDEVLEVKIKKLQGEVWHGQNQWHLSMRYDVEFEGPEPQGKHMLRLSFLEAGRTVVDANGRLVQIDVELKNPIRKGDDEIRFADVLTVDMPTGELHTGEKVRALAAVVRAQGDIVLARKEAGLKSRGVAPGAMEPAPLSRPAGE